MQLIANSDVEGDLRIVEITPLRLQRARKFLGYVLSISSIFIFQLLQIFFIKNSRCRWFVKLRLKFYFSIESEIHYSTHLLIKNSHDQLEIHKIRKIDQSKDLSFKYRNLDYVVRNGKFQPLDSNLIGYDYKKKYINQIEVIQQRKLYGQCQLKVPIPSVFEFLEKELTSPLYFIQFVSVLLWLMEGFVQLAVMTPCLAILTSLINYTILRRSMVDLQKKAENNLILIVKRVDNDQVKEIQIDSTELVPGDIIVVRNNIIMPCDCLILSGSVLVDEQSLSGESIPIQKQSSEQIKDLNTFDYKQNILFDGTKILYTRQQVEALVLRTGYLSYKGQIFRNALYPKPPRIQFFDDAVKFLLVVAVAVIGLYFGLLWKMVELDYSGKIIFLRLGDAIVWNIPPNIVIVVNLSLTASLRRLKSNKILGTQPDKILESSQIDVICFDKTGTLTKNKIDVQNLLINNNGELIPQKDNALGMAIMGTCHQSYMIDNELLGDTLDIAMINHSQYQIQMDEDAKFIAVKGDTVYRVLNIFEFSSENQRMGVVVNLNNQYLYFSKGSPEKIQQLCQNVPENLNQMVDKLALLGFRVLALGYKQIQEKEQHYQMSILEQDMQFLGLLVFENKLKDDSANIIGKLKEVELQLKIISGDHVYSTIQCGKEAGILENQSIIILDYKDEQIKIQELVDGTIKDLLQTNQINLNSFDSLKEIIPSSKYSEFFIKSNQTFAITGSAFEFLQNKSYLSELCQSTSIFARMTPIQKSQVIKLLQLKSHVAMMGDGSNDCHALKQANIGVSFSSADASNTSQFTSQEQSISCIIDILRQGKGTSANILEAFKYYMVINVTKYVSAQLMMYQMQNFNDPELLYLNYFSNIPILALITITSPNIILTKHRIDTSMISHFNFWPLISILIISGLNQLTSYLHLYFQPWYQQYNPNPDQNTYIFHGDQNTQQFLSLNIYLLISFFAINTYSPFKQRLIRQYYVYVPILILLLYGILLQLVQMNWIDDWLQLNDIINRTGFQFEQLGFTLAFSILSVLIGRLSWITFYK